MRALPWVVLALAAGCQLSNEAKVQDVAQDICACLEPGDATCVGVISKQLGSSVPEECTQCVFDNERTCARLIDECPPLCIQQNVTPRGQ
jgi:hypothetical protein